jgi:signal transduction histidine kinase
MPLPSKLHPYPLDTLLDVLSEGILVMGASGEIVFHNTAAAQILETETFDDLFFKESLLLGNAPDKLSLSFKEKELSIRTYLHEENLIILIQDITETKKFEAAAARHDRMKELGDMVAAVAHEIRNPLGGIRGFASLLHRDLKEHPQMQEMAQHIIDGSDHLSRFVTSVLNYSRPAQIHLQPTNLNAFIEELQRHVKADHNLDSRIQFLCQFTKEPLIAPIDAPLLQAALLNLIVNAIQAMPEGGKLSIKIAQQDDSAILQVSDTGVGIAPEHMPKLFSPFFTTRQNGNGFGLAEVKKAIQAHSGKIYAESIVNKGTTFTIQIPIKRDL